ncbi:MAG TPA: dihydrofolate reductase family protein [Thermoleophilaceae bacterium]|jgi:dihydrofolate reductase
MATVVADMSMSLDGFVAGGGDRVDEVFSWITAGDVAVESDNPDLGYEVDEASAEELRGANVKALVIGRRTFDLAGGWGGMHPVGVPVWIPTHDPPEGWDDAPFTFVTEGVEAAVEHASEHADDGIVGVGGASVAQQCLNAGILDAVRVSLVPYLIGEGIPYFAGLTETPVKLGQPKVVEGKGVTHLYYEVER